MNQERIRLNNIQMLRGLAALFVVFHHILSLPLVGGAVGVDIFFIISGFIIMYTTNESSEKFFLKRAIRVIPLYYIATFIFAGLLIIFLDEVAVLSFSISSLIKSLLFIPHEVGIGSFSMLTVGWTLNYEMFFYLVFGLSAFISKKIKKWDRGVTCSIAITLLVLIGVFVNVDNIIFNFWTDAIMLEFVLGILSYYLYKYLLLKIQHIKNVYKIIAFMLFICMILICFFITDFDFQYRFIIWGIPSLVIFVTSFIFTHEIKIPKALIMLGNISFSLYLLHSFVIRGVDYIVYPFQSELSAISICVIILAVFISILLSYFSWFFLEKKISMKLNKLFKI